MSDSFIDSREDFVTRYASEKLTIVHVECTRRLINFNLVGGGIYNRVVPNYVVNIADCVDDLVYNEDHLNLNPGEWSYLPLTGELYVRLTDDSDPGLTELVATYRLFYSEHNLTFSHNAQNDGTHVLHQGRLESAPGYNHKIGYEQNLTSVVGQGSLRLHNQDGELDEIFDKYYFENGSVRVYSWNKDLDFSDAQIIYRGRITNKSFDLDKITFTVKDPLFDLQQPVPTGLYEEGETNDRRLIGKSKRWVYGRVDGLIGDSLDKVGDGIDLTGTASIRGDEDRLNGTGTLFLTEVTPDDRIVIEDQEFTVKSIISDTLIELSSVARNGFTDKSMVLKPKTAPTYKNRRYQLTSHACSESTATITEVVQLNRLRVDSTVGFFAGDLLQNLNTGEKILIKNVAPGNIIVLQQAYSLIPQIGDSLLRLAVQSAFHNGDELLEEDITIDNTSAGCFVTLSEDAEANIAPILNSNIELTFINGSRNVIVNGDYDIFKNTIEINNLIRPSDLSYTTFYSVIRIEELESTSIDFEDYMNANFPIQQYGSFGLFPVTGMTGRIYKIFTTGDLYAWDGVQYVAINDIDEAPATNYHTTSRLYIKNEDQYKYDVGMTITIESGGMDHTSEILAVNRVDGNSYIDLVTPAATAFQNGDSIKEMPAFFLRQPFADPSIVSTFEYKQVEFIQDNSTLSFNVLGKTKDGLPSGEWIQTGSEAALDLIKAINIEEINVAKFDEASENARQLLSLSIPQSPNQKPQATRDAINLINRSVIGSLNMDNDLKLQYTIMQPEIDEEQIPEVADEDVISWKVNTVNGDLIQSVGIDYRHQDYNISEEGKGSENVQYSYEFVDKYIGTTNRDDLDVYLYETFDATVRSHRETYYRSLSRSDITFTTDLRLEHLNIGDSIVVNFRRLYRRLGDNYNKKVVMVVGKRVTGQRITYFCTDFGNIYNRSNIITRNDAPCYEDATEEEKLKLGFITDNRGIIDDNEDTHNNHLIN